MPIQHTPGQRALFQEHADLFDLTLVYDEPVKAGDDYLGLREGRVCLLTAKTIHPTWIEPTATGYCYNLEECVKVRKNGICHG